MYIPKIKAHFKSISFVTVLTLSVFNQVVCGEPVLINSGVPVVLVVDDDMSQKMPSNFRSSNSPYKSPAHALPTRSGLDDLNMSGSGQFSKTSLENAIKTMKGKIWVIDLRQESHGFVNGIPISWYGPRNASNANESSDNILRQEGMLLNDVNRQRGIMVSKIIDKDEGVITKVDQFKVPVELVESEYALTSNHQLNYLRIGVQDHNPPDDNDIDEFVNFVKNAPKDIWMYFHCRGGEGRTSTFMAMYDMLRNAKNVSLLDIINRQALLGGKNLFDISQDPKDAWKKQEAINRKEFMEKFYQYAADNKGFPKQTWSQWNAKQSRPFNRLKQELKKEF